MAQTRIQRAAAAKAAATAATDRPRPANAQGRSLLMKQTAKKNNRVRWSSSVAVKDGSAQALNDADTITVVKSRTGNTGKPRGTPGALKQGNQSSNVRTVADLPVSPTSPISPGTVPIRSANSNSKVRTLSDVRPIRSGPVPSTTNARLPKTFGPGQALDPTAKPVPMVDRAIPIHRSSLLESIASPRTQGTKRARANSSAFYEPAQKRPHIEYDGAADLAKLINHPRALAPVEVSALFTELKRALHKFAADHFKQTIDNAEDWPLHELADRFLPLMRTTMYIADGSQYGWREFFTSADSRAALVYGVISEHIRNHVFEMPSFGLSEGNAKLMESVDHIYLHYDAFTRVKRRASLLAIITRAGNWQTTRKNAVQKLAADLLEVLTPLLPSEIFSYDSEISSFVKRNDEAAVETYQLLSSQLENLIEKSCAMSWSSILTGKNGSVINFATHLPKGEKWYGDMGAPQNCINREMMYQTQQHGFTQMDKSDIRAPADVLSFPNGCADTHHDDTKPRRPRVQMTCFPRVQMFVPHGVDQQRLAQIQQRRQNEGKDPADVPAVLSTGEVVWPVVPEMVKREYERSKGGWPKDTEMRMGYVDLYQHLTPHDVYLEHNFVEDTEEEFVRAYTVKHSKPAKPVSSQSTRRGNNNPDDDSEASSDAESEISASTTSTTPSPSPSRIWQPGHSQAHARKLYAKQHAKTHHGFSTFRRHLHSHHPSPLPASQRLSLEQAVAEARTQHASRSVTRRLGLAVHDQILAVWNKLIAPHGTRIENWGVLLAVAALVCWYRGYTQLPKWVAEGLRRARNLRLEDVKATLLEIMDGVSQVPSMVEDVWAKGSAKLAALLPAQSVGEVKSMVDNQGNVVTRMQSSGVSMASAAASSNVAAASGYLSSLWEDMWPRSVGSAASSHSASSSMAKKSKNTVKTVTEPLTTAVVMETSTKLKAVTVSTPPVGGIVPGSGKDGKMSSSRK